MGIWKEINVKDFGRMSISCICSDLSPNFYCGLMQTLYCSFSEDHKLYALQTYIGNYRRNRAIPGMIGTEYLVISVV